MTRIYSFGGGSAEGSASMKDLLGGKGANLAEMSSLGLPVPAGFTITTDVCMEYLGSLSRGGRPRFPATVARRIVGREAPRARPKRRCGVARGLRRGRRRRILHPGSRGPLHRARGCTHRDRSHRHLSAAWRPCAHAGWHPAGAAGGWGYPLSCRGEPRTPGPFLLGLVSVTAPSRYRTPRG